MIVSDTLQRLFSTFPNGWPGLGLLLFRLGLCSALICFGFASPACWLREPAAADVLAAFGSLFLLAGLWTPVMGTLTALCQMWLTVSVSSSQLDQRFVHIVLAVLAVSLAMLGPGAWSIDARLFGMRRIEIDRTRGRRNTSK
jgi:putative oxidoreductase